MQLRLHRDGPEFCRIGRTVEETCLALCAYPYHGFFEGCGRDAEPELVVKELIMLAFYGYGVLPSGEEVVWQHTLQVEVPPRYSHLWLPFKLSRRLFDMSSRSLAFRAARVVSRCPVKVQHSIPATGSFG